MNPKLTVLLSGRPFDWVLCVLPNDTTLSLATVESPFYSARSDPVYARRIRNYRSDWNLYDYNALYPVFTTRTHRIIDVITQPVDLYPVFSDSDDNQNETPFMM